MSKTGYKESFKTRKNITINKLNVISTHKHTIQTDMNSHLCSENEQQQKNNSTHTN